MKVIFLDIDGVLVTLRSFAMGRSGLHAKADPDTVAALNTIIEATGASIVISSTWRLGRGGVGRMRDTLKLWGCTGKVVDRTPDLPRPRERGDEIQQWLDRREAQRGDVESFVILDDDADMAHLMPLLVQTEFERGLTTEHAEVAIRILDGRAS